VSRRHKGAESESFAGRVARLADELRLAIEWNRPSILFAIYQSHFVMEDAQNALALQLRGLGQEVERYVVNRENADIPMILSHHPGRERTVFYVQGLQFGGEAAVRALNIRREYFVEKRIRAVFWLTEYEATALAHSAPDFWSFRHRSVDFMDVPGSQHTAESKKDLAWTNPETRTPLKDTDAKIALRQRLLENLAETAETLGARAELQATLGALYSAKAEHERAIPYWQEAIENKELLGDARGLALAYGGLASAYAGLGRFDEAEHVYRQSIALEPRLAINYSELGKLYLDLSRDKEAVAAFRQAADLDPSSTDPHLGLGSAEARVGRYDEAVAEYRRAVELDPISVAARNSLGSLYLRQGAPDKAQTEFEAGMSADEKDWQAPFNLGLVRLLQGQPAEARALWEKATTLCRRKNLTESLGRVLLDVATGQSERGLVELRSLLGRKNLPSGTLGAILSDAEMIASAPNPPKEIGDVMEMLRARLAQESEATAGKPTD
jgi:tetratricopeptide (TPR) repeat protein